MDRFELFGEERNARNGSSGLLSRLDLSRDKHLGEPLCRLATVNPRDEVVNPRTVLVDRDEKVRPHDEEEMAHVLRAVVVKVLVAHAACVPCPGQDSTEDIHHDRQAGALVRPDWE